MIFPIYSWAEVQGWKNLKIVTTVGFFRRPFHTCVFGHPGFHRSRIMPKSRGFPEMAYFHLVSVKSTRIFPAPAAPEALHAIANK
jgi:hypothetical protein